METTIIDKGNIKHFTSLLLPDDAKLIADGKPIFALGLVENSVACGALSGGPFESVFRITSLFVAPDYRNRGGASLLLNTLKDLMLAQKSLYQIDVDFTIFNNEHQLLESFLEKTGFIFEKGREGIYSVSLGDLAANPFYFENTTGVEIHRFSNLPPACIRELDHAMRASESAPLAIPLEQADLEQDLSVAVLDGNQIDGFILFDYSFGGNLTLAYADSGSKSGSSVFSALLKTSYQNAIKKYSADKEIFIQAVTPLSTALVEKLASSSKLISRLASLRIRE